MGVQVPIGQSATDFIGTLAQFSKNRKLPRQIMQSTAEKVLALQRAALTNQKKQGRAEHDLNVQLIAVGLKSATKNQPCQEAFRH